LKEHPVARQKMIHAVLSLLLTAFIGPAASSPPPTPQLTWQPAKTSRIQSQFDRKLPEVNFDGVAFDSVLDYIHNTTGISTPIVETCAPDSWVGQPGMPGAIKAIGGRLFITQTRENHRQIENLMAELRETTSHTPSGIRTR
jgi:hypothetical protein